RSRSVNGLPAPARLSKAPPSRARRICSSSQNSQLTPGGFRSVMSVVCSRARGQAMSTSSNLAVVVDPDAPGRLVIRSVPEPVPHRGEAIVRVRALSLNRGEVRRSGLAAAGWRPGWDLAGTVERAAADAPGPRGGARGVGLPPGGAGAERVGVPTHALAELPDKVTFAQAATFPVAGLTALYALAKRGPLLARRVLVTGAARGRAGAAARGRGGGGGGRPGGGRRPPRPGQEPPGSAGRPPRGGGR